MFIVDIFIFQNPRNLLHLSQSFFIPQLSSTAIHRKRMSELNYTDTLVNEIKTEDLILKRESEKVYLDIQKKSIL